MHKNVMRALGLAVACACFAPTAMATVYDVPVAGNLNGNAFTADLLLDVTNGTATSGSGTFTGFGLTNADLVLITTGTPGNETAGVQYGYGPVGFRANDGTDYFGLNQNYPIDYYGLLFDVGTKVASAGNFPLFNLGNGNNATAFTGSVGDVEYYNQIGTANIGPAVAISAVPEPSIWAMMLLGFGGLGFLAYRKKTTGHAGAEMVAA